MPIDKNELRRVMGHFATGVTVITTVSSDGKHYGLTANAFTSVSLEPPLLLISVDKKAESYSYFEESKVFTVNILADDQEALSRRFAVSGGPKFEGVAYRPGANGAAILEGTLGIYRVQACRGLSRRRPHHLYRRNPGGGDRRPQTPALFPWRLPRAR